MNALALLAAAVLAAAAPPAAARADGAAPVAEPPAPRSPAGAYDAAMALLLDGRFAEAAHAFDHLAANPETPSAIAVQARVLADASRALDARGRFVLRAAPLAPDAAGARRAALDRGGRGELALYGTAYGIWAGIATGLILDWDDAKAYAAAALAGGGGGLALSVLGTRRSPVPSGRTQAIEAGGNWGSLNGGLVAGLLDANQRATVGATFGAGLAGVVGTVALTRARSPSSGDVALATSGAMWGLVTGGLAVAIFGGEDPGEKAILGTLLGATDAGLLTMALLSRRLEISRGRSLLIDAGGLVGTLAGLSIPLFLDSDAPAAYGGAGLAGLAAGLGTATWLTRGWDADDERRAEAVPRAFPWATRAQGGGLVAGLGGRF